ncbi:MAG: hypothetical protein JNK05_06530 [Myxococcales bacterium]|nr:hypothetical protein [Myxococcales bacterium]
MTSTLASRAAALALACSTGACSPTGPLGPPSESFRAGPATQEEVESLQTFLRMQTSPIELRVIDTWDGLGATYEMNAILARVGDRMSGQTVCKRGGLRLTVTLNVAASQIDAIVTGVTTIPVLRDRYRPRIEHTDDYPLRALGWSAGHYVWLYSESQGRDHTPWAIVTGERESNRALAVSTAQAHNAVEALRPLVGFDRCAAFNEACPGYYTSIDAAPAACRALAPTVDNGS